jgi:GTP diphosphokinase / guanosine-3',5'-bis(diphosphate) 3'-diphosphatase
MQVRTEDMHRRAQFGIASHMSYKELGKTAPTSAFRRLSFPWVRDLIPTLLNFKKAPAAAPDTSNKKAAADVPRWLTELADAHASVAGPNDFVEGLKSDFFSHRVFVFTPRGDVIDLPIESTPADFAYAIHSDLGDHMQGAKVNGKLVSFDTKLRNGDVVEIIRRESARPTSKWLDLVKTSVARKHIRAALEEHERPPIRDPIKAVKKEQRVEQKKLERKAKKPKGKGKKGK